MAPATGMRGVPPARPTGSQRPAHPNPGGDGPETSHFRGGARGLREFPHSRSVRSTHPAPGAGTRRVHRGLPGYRVLPGGHPRLEGGKRPPLTRKPFSRSALISASSCLRAAVKPRKSKYSRTSSSVRSAAAAMETPQHSPPTGGEGRARPDARGTTAPSVPCHARAAQGTTELVVSAAAHAHSQPASSLPPSLPAPKARVFFASLLATGELRLRPNWPSATCGSSCWARMGRGAANMGGGRARAEPSRAEPGRAGWVRSLGRSAEASGGFPHGLIRASLFPPGCRRNSRGRSSYL